MNGDPRVYTANLAALETRQPALARRLRQARVTVKGAMIETAATGRPYLRLATVEANVALESAEDPVAEARRTVEAMPPGRDLLMIKGCGLGYLIKAAYASRRFLRILVFEPQVPLFAMMLGITDLRRVLASENIEFFVGEDLEPALRRLKELYDYGTERNRLLFMLPPHMVARHPVMAVSPEYDRKFDEQYRALNIMSDRNRRTLDRFVDIWRNNLLDNIPAILASATVASLAGRARGAPGILVGAGPSLDRNLRCLRAARGRAVITCVDTAYRSLKAEGIVPDYVMAVDATVENLRDFDGVSVGDDPTALVMVPVVHPAIPPLFRHRLVASYGHPLQHWLSQALGLEFGSLLVSGSVSTIGYDLLRQLRCEPVILVGMDLAYAEVTHTRGVKCGELSRFTSAEGRARESTSEARLRLPAWGGKGQVRTTEQMLRWKEWFEGEIARSKWPTVNATEGGVHIEGAVEMPLVQACERFLRRTVTVPPTVPLGPEMKKRVKEALDRLCSGEGENAELERLLRWESGIRSVEQMERIRRELRERLEALRTAL